MVTLITGNKGSGKTKQLIAQVNAAVETSDGNVVVVEQKRKLTTSVTSQARLIAVEEYGIEGYSAFYGFLCGLCAGNYDITDIFIDATLRIGGRDTEELADFLGNIAKLGAGAGTNFTFTISAGADELPARVFEACGK